jgi:hypothetical protein
MQFIYSDGGRKQAGFKGATGDCVTRAIAIAASRPYQEVYDGLNTYKASMRQTKRVRGSSARTGVNKRIYGAYLKTRGWQWVPTMGIGSGCKVHLREGELPMGRLIVRLSGHLAAVIDGVLFDTMDCSRNGTRCVYGYYVQPMDAAR